jgi:hypothetical protein
MITERMQQLSGIQSLNEATFEEGEWLAKEIEKSFKKYFKKSYINARMNTSSGIFKGTLSVVFTLGSGKEDYSYGIPENDPLLHKFLISDFVEVKSPIDAMKDRKYGTTPRVELSQGGTLAVKPEPGSYKAMDRVKIGWRNHAGDPQKLLKYMDKYFAKVHKIIKDNIDNIIELDYDPRSKL